MLAQGENCWLELQSSEQTMTLLDQLTGGQFLRNLELIDKLKFTFFKKRKLLLTDNLSFQFLNGSLLVSEAEQF